MLVIASLAIYVFAQQSVSPARDQLATAIALLNEGRPQEARTVLTNISPTDPEHGVAQFYDALALHAAQDKLGFLNKLEALKPNTAPVPAQLREELAVRQLDALFHYRKFDDLLTNAAAFEQAQPDSEQLQIIAEYRLAALFERGMKKTAEACSTKDQTRFNQRWAEGKTNLEQFLALAASFKGTDYTTIKKHKLAEDIQVARLALGDEKAVLEETAIQDDAVREKIGLLRLNLYQKLQPEQVDRNLDLMKEFLTQFPASKQRQRVEFDMANISFPRGKELYMEAEEAEYFGDARAAAAKRNQAGRYFETVRSVQSEARADKSLGIEASDLLDLRADMLYSYYLEKNYSRLAQLSAALVSESTPGDLKWIQGKVYAGIALRMLSPEKTKEAATIFDEVLALGFKNRPDHDHQLDIAARWRIKAESDFLRALGLTAESMTKAREIFKVENDDPDSANWEFLDDQISSFKEYEVIDPALKR